MATLVEIHDAIAAQLDKVGVRAFGYPPQGANPPVGYVVLESSEPTAMGRQGWVEHTLSVYVFTAESVRPQDGYRALIEYADWSGIKSVWLTLWDGNNRSNGSFVGLENTTLHVDRFDVLGAEQVDEFDMYGGLWTVIVKTLGG